MLSIKEARILEEKLKLIEPKIKHIDIVISLTKNNEFIEFTFNSIIKFTLHGVTHYGISGFTFDEEYGVDKEDEILMKRLENKEDIIANTIIRSLKD